MVHPKPHSSVTQPCRLGVKLLPPYGMDNKTDQRPETKQETCIPVKFNFEAGSNCEAPRKLESDNDFHLQHHTRQADFLWFLQFRVIQGSTRGVPYMYPQEETWGNPLPKFGDQPTPSTSLFA